MVTWRFQWFVVLYFLAGFSLVLEGSTSLVLGPGLGARGWPRLADQVETLEHGVVIFGISEPFDPRRMAQIN